MKCPHCHNTLKVKHTLIECVLSANSRIWWKFFNSLEDHLGENGELTNLIKFLRENKFISF